MGIVVRHEAAGVPYSVDNERRKYGQQLQMQQRKYDMDNSQMAQSHMYDMQRLGAGYGTRRGATSGVMQPAMMAGDPNDFIQEMIDSGQFKGTRDMQGVLAARSSILSDQNLDQVQRSAALQKVNSLINARLGGLQPMTPRPTAQELLDANTAMADGVRLVADGKGGWNPVIPPGAKSPEPSPKAPNQPSKQTDDPNIIPDVPFNVAMRHKERRAELEEQAKEALRASKDPSIVASADNPAAVRAKMEQLWNEERAFLYPQPTTPEPVSAFPSQVGPPRPLMGEVVVGSSVPPVTPSAVAPVPQPPMPGIAAPGVGQYGAPAPQSPMARSGWDSPQPPAVAPTTQPGGQPRSVDLSDPANEYAKRGVGQVKKWTSADGRFTTEGEFLGLLPPQVEGGQSHAVIRKTNGNVINVPLRQLSDNDQYWALSGGNEETIYDLQNQNRSPGVNYFDPNNPSRQRDAAPVPRKTPTPQELESRREGEFGVGGVDAGIKEGRLGRRREKPPEYQQPVLGDGKVATVPGLAEPTPTGPAKKWTDEDVAKSTAKLKEREERSKAQNRNNTPSLTQRLAEMSPSERRAYSKQIYEGGGYSTRNEVAEQELALREWSRSSEQAKANPNIPRAVDVLLNPKAKEEQKLDAATYLRSQGIDARNFRRAPAPQSMPSPAIAATAQNSAPVQATNPALAPPQASPPRKYPGDEMYRGRSPDPVPLPKPTDLETQEMLELLKRDDTPEETKQAIEEVLRSHGIAFPDRSSPKKPGKYGGDRLIKNPKSASK
jgi:hypothetical protein